MGLVRFLLACIVVIFHASPYWAYLPMSGDLSVQCFYIISGFYMALILNEKYVDQKSNLTFYSNRILKIYPIYFSLLVMLIGWSVFVYYKGYPGTLDYYAHYWQMPVGTFVYLVLINIFLIGIDSVFYFGIRDDGNLFFTTNINTHTPYVVQFVFNPFAWTIGIELLFYFIAPYIVRKKIWVALFLIALSLTIRIYLSSIGLNHSPWTYMFFPNQLMFFMGGVISYHSYKRLRENSPNPLTNIFISLLFIVTIIFYNQFFKESYWKQLFLFCFEIFAIPYIFILTKNNKVDRYIGNLSFPIYLAQSLVLKTVIAKSFPKIVSYGFTSLVIIITLSVLLDRFIAQPLERYRQRRAYALKCL